MNGGNALLRRWSGCKVMRRLAPNKSKELALLNGHSMFTDLWVCLSSQTSNASHGEILPRSLESS
jgi:hypothetical protein